MGVTFNEIRKSITHGLINAFDPLTINAGANKLTVEILNKESVLAQVKSYLSKQIRALALEQNSNILLLPQKLMNWIEQTFLTIQDGHIKLTITEDQLRSMGVLKPTLTMNPSLVSNFVSLRESLYAARLKEFMFQVNRTDGEGTIPLNQVPAEYLSAVCVFSIENDRFWIYDPSCPYSGNAETELYRYYSMANFGRFVSSARISVDRLEEIVSGAISLEEQHQDLNIKF
jgi:hypothetical protein